MTTTPFFSPPFGALAYWQYNTEFIIMQRFCKHMRFHFLLIPLEVAALLSFDLLWEA
jgi:hypothetical protein